MFLEPELVVVGRTQHLTPEQAVPIRLGVWDVERGVCARGLARRTLRPLGLCVGEQDVGLRGVQTLQHDDQSPRVSLRPEVARPVQQQVVTCEDSHK